MKRKLYLIVIGAILLIAVIYLLPSSNSSTPTRISGHAVPVELEHMSGRTGSVESPHGDIPAFELGKAIRFRNIEVIQIKGTFSNDRPYITLDRALRTKEVTLHETSDVNELSITNNGSHYVFLQANDIVKGGKQDRTLHMDVVLGPNESNLPLASFCVESGRWRKRGAEADDEFQSSGKALASKDLKLSNRLNKNQSMVWSGVSRQQEKMDSTLSIKNGAFYSVADAESETSYQLSLENGYLNEQIDEYLKAIAPIVEDGVVGLAYAVNGEIYGAEIYNNAVMDSLISKVMTAFVTEAIAEFDTTDQSYAPVKAESWVAFVASIEDTDQEHYQKVNTHTALLSQQGDSKARFTSFDLDLDTWIHISIIEYDSEKESTSVELRSNDIIIIE